MQVYGSPGAYVATMARKAAGRALLSALVAVAGVVLFFAVGSFSALGAGGLKGVTAIASLVAVGGGALNAYEAWTRSQKASIGLRSERQVGKVLDSSGATAVVHGALLGAGGDADHVVLGPVLAVIETKTGHGQVRADAQGLVVGDRRIVGDPLKQAQRQAAALRRLAGGGWVDAVVCIPGMRNPAFQTSRTWVCSLDDLPKVLAQLPRNLPPDRALALAHQILPE